MAEEKSFLGRGWVFPVTFNSELGKVNMVSDALDIRQSLEIYLNTKRGERLLRLNYGTVLQDHVYDTAGTNNLNNLCERLKNDLRIYEPRIIVHHIDIDDNKIAEGLVNFRVEYEIQASNVRDNIVYPFYILEGTNIPN